MSGELGVVVARRRELLKKTSRSQRSITYVAMIGKLIISVKVRLGYRSGSRVKMKLGGG